MNAKSRMICLASLLCLGGTAVAQEPYSMSPYRLTRLDDGSSRNSAWDGATYRYGTPPIGAGQIEQQMVAAPQPISSAQIYAEAIADSPWGAGGGYRGGGHGSTCGCDSCCDTCCTSSRWYGYIGALGMGRDAPNKFWTTYESTDPVNQLQYFPNADWGGGVDTYVGYWFGCDDCCCDCCGCCCGRCNSCGCGGRWGVQAVYWGIWDMDGENNLYDPTNNLSTPIDTGLVTLNGASATAYFDNARQHRLLRDDEVHNVEANLVYAFRNLGRFDVQLLAGIRFFRFGEDLQFGTLDGAAPVDATIDTNPEDAALLDVNVRNNLIGFQIGAQATWWAHDRLGLFITPKLGIFGNHVTSRNSLTNGNGVFATFDDPPGTGDRFDIRTSEDVFSFLASVDLGLNWAFTDNWSVLGGYRVVAVSGVALSDDQIPAFLAAQDEWEDIETNGDLILHGAFAGLEFRY